MFPPSGHHCIYELWDFGPLCALLVSSNKIKQCAGNPKGPLNMANRTVGTHVPGRAFGDVLVHFHHNVSGEMLAFSAGDVSNLSVCRHIVIYVFSHEAKSTLGDSLLHLKPIPVK